MKKAFTLIEATVVVAIIGILTLMAVVTFNSKTDVSNELEAKNTLVNLMNINDNTYLASNSINSLSQIISKDSTHTYQSNSSTGINIISYSPGSSNFGGAVASPTGCWYLLKNYQPSSANPAMLWAYKSGATTCLGSDALNLSDPLTGKGYSEDKPILL